MTKTQLENLIRAKLRCSYEWLQEGNNIETYITYKEAWGMYEVLHTFFRTSHPFSFYYFTCKSSQMQQNEYDKWKNLIEETAKKLLTDS